MVELTIEPVATRADRRAFVRFPWRVYRNDPNWVPPLISDQMATLDPARNAFFRRADVVLFLARRGREVVGTIAAFIDHNVVQSLGRLVGGFGFFEVVDDFAIARALLDAAVQWLRRRGAQLLRGPWNFSNHDHVGVLIQGGDCPPALLESHTPPYYASFLEQYGMEKQDDLWAYRVFRSRIGDNLEGVPPAILRVAEAARQQNGVVVRPLRFDAWDEEIRTAVYLFNTTLSHLPEHIPLPEDDFRRMADQFRPFLDPKMALFAEIDGKPIGFCVALPDVNRVLLHLNGRLFPFNWLRIGRLIKQVDVATFKLMGVLEQYRQRGIESLLYLEAIRGFIAGRYTYLDGSITSESNQMMTRIARRLGAEPYKLFRVYQLPLEK